MLSIDMHGHAPPPPFPQDEADGKAAQAALQRVVGLDIALRKRPAPGLLADTAGSGWGAAFYPAGSLQAALDAVLDAAAQQELLEQGGSGGGRQAAAAENEEARASEGEHGPDAQDLLFAVLVQQAVLLDSEEVQVAEARAATSAAQQQQQEPAAAPAVDAAAPPPQAAAAAAAPAAATAATTQPAAAAWDPQAEKVPRPKAGPDWWRSLSVLHVPQLLYSDGAKGLMSVHVSVPRSLGSPAAASSSNGSTVGTGGGPSGSAERSSMEGGEEAPTQQLLVAFADIKDAEALADCPVQVCLSEIDGVEGMTATTALRLCSTQSARADL